MQRGTRVAPVCLPRRGGRGARFPPSVAVRQRKQPAEAGALLGAGWSVRGKGLAGLWPWGENARAARMGRTEEL